MSDWNVSPAAVALHKSLLVWDNIYPYFDYYMFSGTMSGAQAGHFDLKYLSLERFANSGANVVGLTISGHKGTIASSLRSIASNAAFVRANPDKYVVVRTADDVLKAKSEGKMALTLNFQSSDPLEANLDYLGVYHDLGLRQMLLSYNVQTHAGSGCHETNDSGLSDFGRSVVKEMNQLGIIVDASHTGYRTTMDIFKVSSAPVVFSHSNPAALQAHPRNIRNDQIKACVDSGGVIGVVGFDGFLPGRRAKIPALLDVIDFYVEQAGIEHVGLGLDWIYCEDMFRQALAANQTAFPSGDDGDYDTPAEFLPPEILPQLTEGLLQRGYVQADIRKIMGENWLRVARAVWK